MEFGAWHRLFVGDVGAETGVVGGPAVRGLSGEEGPTSDFARGQVGVRFWASTVGVGEEVGVRSGEVVVSGASVLVDFVVGDVGPRKVVGENCPCPEAGGGTARGWR